MTPENIASFYVWAERVHEGGFVSSSVDFNFGAKCLVLPDHFQETIGFYRQHQKWNLIFQSPEWSWVEGFTHFCAVEDLGLALYSRIPPTVLAHAVNLSLYLPYPGGRKANFPMNEPLRMNCLEQMGKSRFKQLLPDRIMSLNLEGIEKGGAKTPMVFIDLQNLAS